MQLSLIAAVARNGAIGRDNALLWHIPEELKHFKRTTLGCPVLMGRRTYESIGRPLPGRRNIVVSRNAGFSAPGVEVLPSLEAALRAVGDAPKVFVIGGAQLYAQALPLVDELVLTEIDRDFEADTFFPPWQRDDFALVASEAAHAGEPNDFDYRINTYKRR
ncbi:MAG TPA: dihydrofolate reductase [Burkholderiaceae bacterium]|jgi:dihydrofolate reductase|nr:dihydrofolate reductase [Burkholderiaceae bacterium]